MKLLRTIRGFIGLGALVYLIVASCGDKSRYEANRIPKENVRRAKDIVRMWKDGVSSEHVPNLKPGGARQLLLQALDSRADEEVREEARAVLVELARKPHYFAFADRITSFLPHIGAFVAPGGRAVVSDPGEGGEAPGPVPGPKVIVLTTRWPARGPSDGEAQGSTSTPQ